MPITALPETSGRCSRSIAPENGTGGRCCATAAEPANALPGMSSTRSENGPRCCDPNWASLTGAAGARGGVKQRPKSVAREISTPRSMGTGSGRSPPVTRGTVSNGRHRVGGIRLQISSSGRYGVEIRGIFGKRLRDREQPGTRAQNSRARPCRERVIKIGKFGNRRRAVASRQSFKRYIKA
jgi:hypothetical protein